VKARRREGAWLSGNRVSRETNSWRLKSPTFHDLKQSGGASNHRYHNTVFFCVESNKIYMIFQNFEEGRNNGERDLFSFLHPAPRFGFY
jgi:hypothetical protein